jgi:DNA polymerase I
MQANGAEMLRLACCLTTESGIRVCAPMHDALLIEAPLIELDEAVLLTQRLMAEASSVVLDGFELRTKIRTVRWPDRWHEPKGRAIWSAVETILEQERSPAHQRHVSCSSTHSRPISLYVSKEDSTDACD